MAARPWSVLPQGLAVIVRLTPRGGHDGIDGVALLGDGQPVLKVRVRAAPTDGQANAALIATLAKALDLPRSAMTLAGGETARIKRIVIAGEGAALAARLERFVGKQ